MSNGHFGTLYATESQAQGPGRVFTDMLFARPSVLYGIARLLDLGAVFDIYNEAPSPEEADAWAIYSDWGMVAQDFMEATEKVLQEYSRLPKYRSELGELRESLKKTLAILEKEQASQ